MEYCFACAHLRVFFFTSKTTDKVTAAMAMAIKLSAGLPNSGTFGVGELVLEVELEDAGVAVGAAVDVDESDIIETVLAFALSAPPFAIKISFLEES